MADFYINQTGPHVARGHMLSEVTHLSALPSRPTDADFERLNSDKHVSWRCGADDLVDGTRLSVEVSIGTPETCTVKQSANGTWWGVFDGARGAVKLNDFHWECKVIS